MKTVAVNEKSEIKGKDLFSQDCIICMNPGHGAILNDFGGDDVVKIYYCAEHLENAKNHKILHTSLSEDFLPKVFNVVSWGLGLLTFVVVAGGVFGGGKLDTFETIVSVIFGFLVKGGSNQLMNQFILRPIYKSRANKVGLTIEEAIQPFYGVALERKVTQLGSMKYFNFPNDEYGELFEQNMKELVRKANQPNVEAAE